jgi:hypothetical protein
MTRSIGVVPISKQVKPRFPTFSLAHALMQGEGKLKPPPPSEVGKQTPKGKERKVNHEW